MGGLAAAQQQAAAAGMHGVNRIANEIAEHLPYLAFKAVG